MLARQDFRWAAKLNATHLNAAEFFKAAAHLPITFVRVANSGEYAPVAVLGLRSGDNLFIDTQGRWRPDAYLPAYLRRYPYCVAEIQQPKGDPRRLVCVQEDHLSASVQPHLFRSDGQPNAAWLIQQQQLEALEAARQQTRVLCRRLEALCLFVAFEALALPRKGQRTRLQGLFRVDEEKLRSLSGRDLRTLLQKGELRAIYAHLLSLENFARLMDYDTERAALPP